jgi:hypothetical protein
VLPLFLPVAVAVVGGDAVAGEASAGTLRPAAAAGRPDPVAGGEAGRARRVRVRRARRPGGQPSPCHIGRAATVAPYLLTRYWLPWIDLFRDPIPWRDIQRGLAIQLVYVAAFLAAAWANPATKDVKTERLPG